MAEPAELNENHLITISHNCISGELVYTDVCVCILIYDYYDYHNIVPSAGTLKTNVFHYSKWKTHIHEYLLRNEKDANYKN